MPHQFDLLLPMEHVMQGQEPRRFAILESAGRLMPGETIAQARSEMGATAVEWRRSSP